METELTRGEILRLFESKELLQTISERSLKRLTPELSMEETLCIELHNEGAIDILSLTDQDCLAAIPTSSFFRVAHAIGRLIPDLTSDATAMMQSVDRLIARAGNDLAANLPNGELLKWFERHPDEAKSVLTSARKGEPLAVQHVTWALQAINEADEARSIIEDFTDDRRLAALTAMSRIEEANSAEYQKSLQLLDQLLQKSPDDTLRAHILGAASWILEKCEAAMKAAATEVLCRASIGGGKMTRYSAAFSLRQHVALVQAGELDSLIYSLSETTTEELGTVSIIDGAISTALKGHPAINLISTLIDKSDGGLTLKNFPCFVSSLSTSSDELARITMAWLLSGSPALCNALSWHFQHSSDEAGSTISVPTDALPKTDDDCIFMARKAVGWLILKPVTATSILVSLMRVCSQQTADAIADLIGSMLLANYASVENYLETLRDDAIVGKHISEILATNRAYLDGLQSVPDIPELRPSESHLRVQHERRALRARETNRAAREQSVFMSMIKQSRILHGAGTLSTTYGPGGETRRVDTPFRTIGYSVELPRLETIDPIGFDMALRVLRLERRTP